MSKPIRTDCFDAAVAEAPPVTDAPAIASKKAAAKVELGGDEIIQFSIRPSLWFVAIVSATWVIGLGLVAAAVAIVAFRGGWTHQTPIVYQVLVAVAAVRAGVATLQWASRLYLLTNRRVMRIKGVLKPDVAECQLARISRVDVYAGWYHRPLRLGSIQMTPGSGDGPPVVWEHLAHADDVHAKLVRAIRKAQSGE